LQMVDKVDTDNSISKLEGQNEPHDRKEFTVWGKSFMCNKQEGHSKRVGHKEQELDISTMVS
jgi:hypothetical protein